MSYRFVCDHCKNKFELETPEVKECPFCFWSSSIKREDELVLEKKGPAASSKKKASGPGFSIPLGKLAFLFRILLFIAIFAGAGFLAFKVYGIFVSASSRTFSIKPGDGKERSSKAPAPSGIAALLPQEKEELSREVTVTGDRVPDSGEQTVLGRTISLQTGQVEKLPSAVWTLSQYQKLIADQEAFYKMPFARSYKKKLEELFKTKYLAASDAFTKGDVLAARNLWVESLGFPLYSTDLKKHRAVALTMLRPFINDTLSKISTMNQSLVDKNKRMKEEALSKEYSKLTGLIAQKKWQEAFVLAGSMITEVDLLRKSAKVQDPLPQYPASFGSIDADLQRPLMDLMTPNPSTMADLQPLEQDLVEKKQVLETFTEAYVKDTTAAYQAALGLIREERWQDAVQALGSIQGPPALQQDAAQKVAILGKILKESQSANT